MTDPRERRRGTEESYGKGWQAQFLFQRDGSECRTGSRLAGQEWTQKATGTVQVRDAGLGVIVGAGKGTGGQSQGELWRLEGWGCGENGRRRDQDWLLGSWLNRSGRARQEKEHSGEQTKSSVLFQYVLVARSKGWMPGELCSLPGPPTSWFRTWNPEASQHPRVNEATASITTAHLKTAVANTLPPFYKWGPTALAMIRVFFFFF